MTKYDDYKTIREAKYASITSFIANPEPEGTTQNYGERITTLEELIAELIGV